MSTTALHHPLIPASSDRPSDDPIFALHAEATKRARAGESIVDATIGALCGDGGELATLESVFEAYRRVSPVKAAAYAPISGTVPFLSAVIEDLFGGGAPAVAVATPGGTGAIHHAIVNALEPGQKLLTTSYYWGPYAILAEHTRRGVATFRTFDGEGRFDLAAYEEALAGLLRAQGRALVVLNTPCHNPTGYSLDDEEWRGVVEITERAAARGPTSLLLDHAYAKFAPEGEAAWRPHLERLSESAGVFVAWTASKSFAQYGARVGSLVALHPDGAERRRIANALGYSCRGTWSNCNHLGMLAITEVLTDPELSRRSVAERGELRSLLDARVREFNRHARELGLQHPRYEGGFFVTVFSDDARGACERARAAGVYVVPVSGGVRVALCATPASQIGRLCRALA